MTKLKSIGIAIFILAVSSAQAQVKKAKINLSGFKTQPSGLKYKFVIDKPGIKKAVENSMVTMHIRTTVNDSILFDSYAMNENQPVPAQITAPSFNGDVMEGLSMMTEGDSCVFLSPADSIFRNNQFPPFVKPGDVVQFTVKMVSVKTKEEHEAEAKAESAKQIALEDKQIRDYIKTNKLKALKTASGLYYVITKPGKGENAKAGQNVTMNYTGKLLDGTVFDSNVDPAFGHVQPFDFKLGTGQVIKGWDEGIALLNTGAKGMLIIPSPLAYGTRSMPGGPNNPKGIPANSILIFDVEMVKAE